jgi:hypothetical protein
MVHWHPRLPLKKRPEIRRFSHGRNAHPSPTGLRIIAQGSQNPGYRRAPRPIHAEPQRGFRNFRPRRHHPRSRPATEPALGFGRGDDLAEQPRGALAKARHPWAMIRKPLGLGKSWLSDSATFFWRNTLEADGYLASIFTSSRSKLCWLPVCAAMRTIFPA